MRTHAKDGAWKNKLYINWHLYLQKTLNVRRWTRNTNLTMQGRYEYRCLASNNIKAFSSKYKHHTLWIYPQKQYWV